MDYGRIELADRLAAGYVAGTLRGPARRRLEALLPAHPALRDAVRAWQDRLMPLTGVVAPVEPSPALWPRIEARIAGGAGAAAVAPGGTAGRWWERLSLWRGATALAAGLAVVLAVGLANPGPARPPLIVVMAPVAPASGTAAPAGGVATAGFVASVSADGRAMVARPVLEGPGPAGRSLELWALKPGGAPPVSLGVVAADRPTVVERGRVLDGTTGFAVSLEPPGGSPTGVPTGPVLYVGKLST